MLGCVKGECGKLLGFEDMVGDAASGNGGEFDDLSQSSEPGLRAELSWFPSLHANRERVPPHSNAPCAANRGGEAFHHVPDAGSPCRIWI